MRNKRLLNRQETRELVREYLEDIEIKFLKFADFESRQHIYHNILYKIKLNLTLYLIFQLII